MSRPAMPRVLGLCVAVGVTTFAATFGLVMSYTRGGAVWDLGSFLASGWAANRGIAPYGKEALPAYLAAHPVSLTSANLTPPISVSVFQLVAEVEPRRAFRTWWGVSLALHLACLASLLRASPGSRPLRALWGLAFAGHWSNLGLGQIYGALAALATVAHHALERRPLLAGACIGTVAAWKPNLLLWPILLLAGGEARVAGAAFLAFAATWAVPAVLLGPGIYPAWATTLAEHVARPIATNASVTGWLGILLPAWIVWGIAATTLLAAAAWVRRQRPSPRATSDLALTLALALSPIAWVGYTLLLLPVFLRRTWNVPVAASAALLLLPANVVWRWSSLHPGEVLGSRVLYPLALVLLVAGLVAERTSAGHSADGGAPTP